jgi:hypothetical protein
VATATHTACPRRDGTLDLVFPNETGKVEAQGNTCYRFWYPLQSPAA